MSPVTICADEGIALIRSSRTALNRDTQIRLDIGPPRHEVRSLARTTRLVEILCRCRFLSTRFRRSIQLKFFSLLTQIYINVATRPGRQTEHAVFLPRTM